MVELRICGGDRPVATHAFIFFKDTLRTSGTEDFEDCFRLNVIIAGQKKKKVSGTSKHKDEEVEARAAAEQAEVARVLESGDTE